MTGIEEAQCEDGGEMLWPFLWCGPSQEGRNLCNGRSAILTLSPSLLLALVLKKSWDYLLSPHSSISPLALLNLSPIALCCILISFPSLFLILLYPYLISFSLSLSLSFLLLFCCILSYFLLSLSLLLLSCILTSFSPLFPLALCILYLISFSLSSLTSPLCNPLTGLPIRWRGCPTCWVGATVARSCCRDIQGRPWQLYCSPLCGWSRQGTCSYAWNMG